MSKDKIEYYGYVYVTINLINFKTYVGQHKSSTFDNAYHGSGRIYKRAVKKYGIKNFVTYPLCWCCSKAELDEYEKAYIRNFRKHGKATYNLASGGEGGAGIHLTGNKNPFYGRHHTKATRAKISAMTKKRTGKLNPFYGKTFDEETKKKISRLGWHHSEQDKIKVARSLMHGRKITCEYCKNIFLSKYEYQKHLKKFHQADIKLKIHNHIERVNSIVYECPYCHRKIKSKGNLTQHIRARHKEALANRS